MFVSNQAFIFLCLSTIIENGDNHLKPTKNRNLNSNKVRKEANSQIYSTESMEDNLLEYVTEKTTEPITATTVAVGMIANVTDHIKNMTTSSGYSPSIEKRPDDKNLEEIIKSCPTFKKTSAIIDLDEMIDVWEPIYYQMQEPIPCFKMLIRKISKKEKNLYLHMYGNFSSTVNWNDCNLEIKSSFAASNRKHFLEGTDKGNGVLKNVILERDGKSVHLIDESADQWLSLDNLLLLQDCFSGEIVVFTKVPYLPKLQVIKEALFKIENSRTGRWACNDPDTPKTQTSAAQYEFDYSYVLRPN